MIFLHDFLSCFSVMTLYQSQTIFMFSHHNSLSNDLHVSLYVSLYDFLSNDLHVFPSWLYIKKIMQKDNAKVEKISIFNSLDVKHEFLTNRVASSWKYAQLDSSRIDNVSNSTSNRVEFKMSTRNSTWRSV